jgi:hypothetical protein
MALSVTVHGFMTLTGTQTAGRWGTANITTEDGADTVVYTVPNVGVDYMILAVSITNRAPVSASNVSVAISSEVTPRSYEFIEYNSSLVPSGTLERTQIMASPGDKIFVRWGVPAPRHQLRVIDNGISSSVVPMGITILPDSTAIVADCIGTNLAYLRKIDATGTEVGSAQYTFPGANSNVLFAPRTSDNLDIMCATTGADTFYEFNSGLANVQDEGFVYSGGSGYENMVATDFVVGGANNGTSTFDLYRTSNWQGNSQLYTSSATAGDIETGISVVWQGDLATGARVKKYTTDNGSDTMLSTGYADQGTGTNKVLWVTALNNTSVIWESYIALGNTDTPAEDLEPVGHYYWQGNLWILTGNGRLISVDTTDGTVAQEFVCGVDGETGEVFGGVDQTIPTKLFHSIGNSIYWVSTSGDANKERNFIWKYTIGLGLQYVHEIDHNNIAVTGTYTPVYLNSTTDRVYVQMVADVDVGGVQFQSYLYDIQDEDTVDLEYDDDTTKVETIANVTGIINTGGDVDQNSTQYTIPYPTDITVDETDVATSPLVVDASVLPTIRLVDIEPPAVP